jgi:ATP-dependent DNA helicase RecG
MPESASSPSPPPAGPSTFSEGLATPLQFVKGVGPRIALTLQKLGLLVVEDLLYHFPHRYEDRRNFRPLGQARHNETVCSSGQVVGVTVDRTARRGLLLTRVLIQDTSGPAELVFFSQPWLKDVFNRLKGSRVCVYGLVDRQSGRPTFRHPEWEELSDDTDSLHVNRIVPIHPLTEGLAARTLRNIAFNTVQKYAAFVPDVMPRELVGRLGLADVVTAMRQIHFPDSIPALEAARRRLVFDELFMLQMALAKRKRALGEQLPGIPFQTGPEVLQELTGSLPFELTAAQQRVIAEIQADMALPRPMNRLLQGDVGSGKTVVAAAAVLTAVRAGYQAALLVPTEILAEQHYSVLARLLEPLGLTVRRLVGSVRQKGKRIIKEEMAAGQADLLIGTHAIIQEGVDFHRLGLAIVDEQHRFGVLQRMTLVDKGMADHAPHLLVMTATPIPRTLALTVYGDLDVSVIDELPPNRKPIRTHWKSKAYAGQVYNGIRKLVSEGKQAYIVCPLVEESEKLQAKAATELAEHLSTEVFPDLRVGLLHGQMASSEKDEVMEQFRQGELDIMVATVVIEVGVDVPNACCMIIEDAERFGLAQLHQLRGRVGRGEDQSYCVLLGDPKNDEARQRLQAMVETCDGFRIAEVDLKLRGPGEFYGTRQSGVLRLRIANIVGDTEILELARREAFDLVDRDPELEEPDHHRLRDHLNERYADIILATVG